MDKYRRPKILWSIKADDTLQLWPSADSECALTAPFLPAHLVNTPKFPQITAPSHAAAGFLEREGISAAAFSIHSKSYYSERVNKKFSTIMYTISGSARAEFGGNVKILKAGSCFLSAKSANTKLRVNNRWEVLWFHFKDSPLSCAMFGSESKLFESKNFKEILWLAQSYRDKVYSKSLNRRALEAHPDCAGTVLTPPMSLDFNMFREFALVRELLADRPEALAGVDAVICHNDIVAHGVASCALERGRVPGRDLLLSGEGNFRELEYWYPVITTSCVDYPALTRRICELIRLRMQGSSEPFCREELSTSLVNP